MGKAVFGPLHRDPYSRKPSEPILPVTGNFLLKIQVGQPYQLLILKVEGTALHPSRRKESSVCAHPQSPVDKKRRSYRLYPGLQLQLCVKIRSAVSTQLVLCKQPGTARSLHKLIVSDPQLMHMSAGHVLKQIKIAPYP